MTQTFNYGHICWIYGQLLSQPERFLPDADERERLLPTLREHAARLTETRCGCLPSATLLRWWRARRWWAIIWR